MTGSKTLLSFHFNFERTAVLCSVGVLPIIFLAK